MVCLKLYVSVAELLKKKQASWLLSPACFLLAYNNISRILLLFTNNNDNGGYHLLSCNYMPDAMLSPV